MEEVSLPCKSSVYRGGPTETAIMRKAQPFVAPVPKKGVCSTCGRRETLPSLRFKSKELEDKFNCFYNRLVETSNEESSEVNTSKDDHALSTDRSLDDRKTDSGKETADTSLSEQPSEDFDSRDGVSPVEKEFPTTIRAIASRAGPSSSHYGEFSASAPRRKDLPKHTPSVHVSAEDMSKNKSHSMSSLGIDFRIFSRQRKAVSDNSLKKISLRNLPHFLRSLSSQSTSRKQNLVSHKSQSGQLTPYSTGSSRPIPYCRSEATIVNRSPVWSLQGSLAKVTYSDDNASSGADDADIEDDDEVGNERAKVLVHRKPKDKTDDVDASSSQQQTLLCGTVSSASDDTPLIDREHKPAT